MDATTEGYDIKALLFRKNSQQSITQLNTAQIGTIAIS